MEKRSRDSGILEPRDDAEEGGPVSAPTGKNPLTRTGGIETSGCAASEALLAHKPHGPVLGCLHELVAHAAHVEFLHR